MTGSGVAADGPDGTDLPVKTAGADGTPGVDLLVRVRRILQPVGGADPGDGGPAWVAAPWRRTDGTQVHGIWATARPYPARAAG